MTPPLLSLSTRGLGLRRRGGVGVLSFSGVGVRSGRGDETGVVGDGVLLRDFGVSGQN